MCGRYTLHQKAENIAQRFNISAVPDFIPENYNVAPGQIMPVITQDESGRHLEFMKWGLIPIWAKDPHIGYKLINARDDSIFEKPMWRGVIRKKRAIIPADGFYEWKKPANPKDKKQPYYIHPKQGELFGFAGVWESWKDTEGKEHMTYSIITTEPNKEMTSIHNRMPVILHPQDERQWLDPTNNDNRSVIASLLRPYDDEGLDVYEVSTNVNVVKNNDSQLIYPLNSR
jgi:putative SOS response-associated peptidase YedK